MLRHAAGTARRHLATFGGDSVVVTCALNGVLTDPDLNKGIPVTPSEMAASAKEAHDAGASVVHIHFRNQTLGKGHLPTWEPEVAAEMADAILAVCPDIIVNFTSGTVGTEGPAGGGPLGPTGGPIACLDAAEGRVHMAAMNSGSLNYLKMKRNGEWAWPPMLFENSVEKIMTMVDAMQARGIVPECECFDTGIVRSIKMFEQNGFLASPYTVSLVMGVGSGMPCRADLLPILVDELSASAQWQAICVGRKDEVWPTLRRAAELGGNVRTGLEDTFVLPDGSRAESNGALIEALVGVCREVGREPASPAEAREILGIKVATKPVAASV